MALNVSPFIFIPFDIFQNEKNVIAAYLASKFVYFILNNPIWGRLENTLSGSPPNEMLFSLFSLLSTSMNSLATTKLSVRKT